MHSRRLTAAFTLIELLTVIAIIGLLAALVTPVLLNFRKGDAMLAATRAMLDGFGRARQLAISQHTTVYMVFVPPNFWNTPANTFNSGWFNGLNQQQQTTASNLCEHQLTGFTFVTLRSIGDQPGQTTVRYLSEWHSLPEKAFIAFEKFAPPPNYQVGGVMIPGFSYTNNFPFPTEDSPIPANSGDRVWLPYIAFNYVGQMITNVPTGTQGGDAYIPLAHGSVAWAHDSARRPLFASADVKEQPAGNSYSATAYNLIHVDALTGRARHEQFQMK